MKQKSFITGAAILGLAGLIAKIIGAFYRVPLTRIIGVEGMGIYQIAYPIYTYLLVISTSGVPTAISKLVSEKCAHGDYAGAKKIFGVSIRILILLGLITSLFMGLFGEAIASWLGDPLAADAIRCIAPALFLVAVMSAYRGYFQGMQSMAPTAVSQIVEQAGKLGLGLYLAHSWMAANAHLGLNAAVAYGAAGAMLGVTLSELAALIFVMGVYRGKRRERELMLSVSAKFGKERFGDITKRLMSIALPVTIGASVVPLMGLIDAALINNQLMSTGYTQEAARSLYGVLTGVVNTLVNMPAVLTVALCMSLVPAIAECHAKKHYGAIKNRTGTAMKLSMIVGLPCAIGLFALAQPIINLLYPSIENTQIAVELLQMMCLSVIFLAMVQTSTGIMQGMGKPVVPVINLLIGAAIKIVMSLIFIRMPVLNIKGAALGSIACYGVTGLLDVYCATRMTKIRFKLFAHILKPLAASLVMGGIAYMGYSLMQGKLPLGMGLLLTIAVSVLVYVLMLLILRVLNESDILNLPKGESIIYILKRMKLMKE